jgi:hypothetical protein
MALRNYVDGYSHLQIGILSKILTDSLRTDISHSYADTVRILPSNVLYFDFFLAVGIAWQTVSAEYRTRGELGPCSLESCHLILGE